MTSIRWLGSPTSSAASPTSHRAGFPNCCHGIGNIRTCGWPLELWRPSPTSSRSGVLPRSWSAMKTCYGSCPTSSSPKTGSCGFTLSMALKPPPSWHRGSSRNYQGSDRSRRLISRRVYRGAQRMLTSLIEACKLNDVEPQAYLADVLVRLVNLWPNNRLDELLPWTWAAARQQQQRAAA